MNQDLKKTLIFAGIAVLAIIVAWEPWRRTSAASGNPQEGKVLFPKLTDAKVARSLDVVKFDESDSTLRPFSIVYNEGTWKIPSHSNYPADAAENLAKAATSLMNLKILNVASSNPGDQELYGVIEPDAGKLKVGAVGVGTRVTIKGDGDKKLADLIVGKEVKDKPDQRYVRQPGKDPIYVVALRTDKLSTKFGDWIEKDLLKLNSFDIHNLELHDYSVELGQTAEGEIGINKDDRSRIRLSYDDDKSKWNIDELVEFDEKGEPVETKLGENEEINTEKLNAMKTALDDLQIVDVERKPAGLSKDLRASEDFVKNQQTVQSLARCGFIPVRTQDGIEILSTEGEVLCGTKDGVEYVLRFGQVAGSDTSADSEKKDDKPAGEKSESKGDKVNRFLFVTARFNQNLIPAPKLEALPGEEAAKEEPAESADAAKDTPAADGDKAKADAKPATDKKPDAERKPAAGKAVPEKKTAQTEGAADGAKAEDAAADQPDSDAKPADEKPAAAKATDPEAEAKAQAEKRAQIEKENKRKQDEYDGKVKKGQEKITELNNRFADWYYVISDDVYKKIHLGKADIVKQKEKPAGKGDGVGDLNALEKGLNPGGATDTEGDQQP